MMPTTTHPLTFFLLHFREIFVVVNEFSDDVGRLLQTLDDSVAFVDELLLEFVLTNAADVEAVDQLVEFVDARVKGPVSLWQDGGMDRANLLLENTIKT